MTAGRKLAIGQEESGGRGAGRKGDPFNYLCMWQDTVAATDAPATATTAS